MVSYPDQLPLDEIKSVINIVKSGTVKENLPTLFHDAWVIQGYAQRMLVGDPDNFSLASSEHLVAANQEKDPEAGFRQLQLLAEQDGTSAQAAIDWKEILEWLVTVLIKKLLENF